MSPYPDAEEREEQHHIPACRSSKRLGTRADNLLNSLIFLLQTVSPGVFATAQQWMKLAVTPPGWVGATLSGRSSSPQPVLGEKQFDLVCNLEYLSRGHWDEELMDSLQGTATPIWIWYFLPRAQAVPTRQKRTRSEGYSCSSTACGTRQCSNWSKCGEKKTISFSSFKAGITSRLNSTSW